MTGRDPLGDRMKMYEAPYAFTLPRRTYAVLRVDGRAFHTFLRHADKPFDAAVVRVMRRTAERMCRKVAGCVLAYTQSDEISLVLQDFATINTEPWFGGVVQKMASVAASTVTSIFTVEYAGELERSHEDDYPTFDARVFTISDPVEVANYLLWRQRDCVKNSIGALALAHFSSSRLHNLSSDQRQELLWREKQVNWNDLDPGLKRGWLARRVGETTELGVRTRWETTAAPDFNTHPDGALAGLLPELPRLRGGA